MSIEIVTPNGPFVIGPGAHIRGTATNLGLANPPYLWTFDFTTPDNTAHWQHLVSTDEPTEVAAFRLLWSDLDTPAPLLRDVHANPGDSIRVQATVRNEAGETLDQSAVIQVPWQPLAWLNANTFLWADNLVGRITAAGVPSDKIDQILAAVYRTWPDA